MKPLLPSLLLSATTLLSAISANAESFTLSDIRINGLQRISAGSVFAALPLDVGSEVDDTALSEASRALFKTGFFENIELGRDGNILVINLTERPTISNIKLSGNKAIKSDDLLKGLAQAGLAEGEIFQRATLEGLRNELQRQYVAQGRYSAEVQTEVVKQPRNRVALKVNIKEGSVANIVHINVVGNNAFPTDDLVSLFELKTTNWLSFFRNDDKYSREKLSGDLERLRSYYLDRGYIHMDIRSTQVSISPDKKNVYITVNIEEGEQFRVNEVKLAGDLKLPEEELRKLLLVQPGQIFSRQVMTLSSDLITRRLGNEGYTFANVSGMPQTNEEDKTVSLTFYVEPGKRAYVSRINFRGNTKTADEVLRREMRQMEGGWASTYLIDQSKLRLERLGFFKEVNVETVPVPGTDDQVDVNYTVEEQPSGSISASVGYAQNAGLILGGSLSQSNFLGSGNRVSIGLTRSEYQQRYSFSFVDPYWTIDGVSLGYNMFYRSTDYDKLNVDVSSYSVNSYGGGLTFGYPISETANLTFGLSAQQDAIKTGRYTVDEIFDFTEKEGKKYLNYKASTGWANSTLNRGVLANRGHSQSLVLDVALPGSDLTFYKLNYRAQVFTGLTTRTALRWHGEVAYGDAYGSTHKLPFYEHYYAGGFGSVRGFKDDTLGPRSTPSTGTRPGTLPDPDQDRLPFGGNLMLQGGVEYLFPLPFIKDQRQLRTVLFWDVGNVFDTNCSSAQKQARSSACKVSFSNMASSVGLGVTWITAMGPISFSVAAPIKKPDDSDTQVFQFSLGQTF